MAKRRRVNKVYKAKRRIRAGVAVGRFSSKHRKLMKVARTTALLGIGAGGAYGARVAYRMGNKHAMAKVHLVNVYAFRRKKGSASPL